MPAYPGCSPYPAGFWDARAGREKHSMLPELLANSYATQGEFMMSPATPPAPGPSRNTADTVKHAVSPSAYQRCQVRHMPLRHFPHRSHV